MQLLEEIDATIANNILKAGVHIHHHQPAPPIINNIGEVGRNDLCPCGSGKKWKKCGILNTEEHQKLMVQKK